MSNEETKVNGGSSAGDTAAESNGAADKAAESSSHATVTADKMTPEQIEALQTQAIQFRDGWQRERAEFANFKRRVERDMKDTYSNASSDVLKGVLPIIDDFDRALANVPGDLQNHPWLQGVSAIQRKFIKLLDDFGVTVIDPAGEVFDPNLHQAIGTDSVDTVPSGHITKVELRGYVVGERVIRPALVRVNQ
ncbi:MAG: nucleotide exchange factor GrpE [Anaerolineae bacterium]